MNDDSSNESEPEALSDSSCEPAFEESLTVSSANSNPIAKRAEKRYSQQFRHQCLEDPNFKDWLVRPSPEKSSATCKACKKPVSCLKSSLQRHAKSEIHKRGNEITTVWPTATRKSRGNVFDGKKRRTACTRKHSKSGYVLSLQNITFR